LSNTILLVDDDVPFTTVIKTVLEKEGYNVLAAHHAKDARKILEAHSPEIEVMLLDWSMPDISGIDLLREIKREKPFEDLQVIMQTVMDSSQNIQDGIEAGAFFYLVKPVRRELLISTINAALRDYQRRKNLLKKLDESEHSFRFLTTGEFDFRTVPDGDNLAVLIANECPNPQEAILISELFANAVEHGNIGLTYEEKTNLVTENRLNEEVARRLLLKENLDKFVHVSFQRFPDKILVRVEDCGKGFDFKKYLFFDDTRIFDNHGRGIALLNSTFKLQYLENGNKVEVEIPLVAGTITN